MTSNTDANGSRLKNTLKEHPRLFGMLAGLLVLISQTGIAAAGAGAATHGP